jgi:hypothetical protein
MAILSIIETLRSDSGKKFKEDVIRQHAGNELFKRVLEMAYSPVIKFGIKNLPEPASDIGDKGTIDLPIALDRLMMLANREVTGHAALHHVAYLLAALPERHAEIVRLILGKSLKIGCEVSTINKALGKSFIKDTPYQGAVSYDQKKVSNLFAKYKTVYSQTKMDGRYTNIAIDGDAVSMESRQGLPTSFGNAFDFLLGLDAHYGEPLVLNGELLIQGVDRYTSNGIIASLVTIGDKIQEGVDVVKDLAKFEKENGIPYQAMLDKLKVVVWDYIPMTVYTSAERWTTPYSERLAALEDFVAHVGNDKLQIVECEVVSNAADAMQHFLDCRSRGEEGTILKGDAHWQDGKPVHQVKFKNEIELDLVITGGNFGTAGTKNEHVISSLNVESADGLLKTSPAGMSESVMSQVTSNLEALKGTIVTVKCNGVSKDRDGNYSCLHPAVLKFRDDKTVANSLNECIEIDAASQAIGV